MTVVMPAHDKMHNEKWAVSSYQHDVKQNELNVAIHWWGSSEFKYLFMQDRKPVWFRTAVPQRTVLTPPAHTRVTMEGNWPTGNERNTVRWAKTRFKENNRKLQQVSVESTRRQRNGPSCGLMAAITKTRMKHINTARWDSPHASWMNISRESCPALHKSKELIDRICNSVPLQELQPPQTSYCWTATAICWAAVVLI